MLLGTDSRLAAAVMPNPVSASLTASARNSGVYFPAVCVPSFSPFVPSYALDDSIFSGRRQFFLPVYNLAPASEERCKVGLMFNWPTLGSEPVFNGAHLP